MANQALTNVCQEAGNHELTDQALKAIADHAGVLSHALGALDPLTKPVPVNASLKRMPDLYRALNEAQDAEIQAGMALAQEAGTLLAAVMASPYHLMARLPKEARTAADELAAIFRPATPAAVETTTEPGHKRTITRAALIKRFRKFVAKETCKFHVSVGEESIRQLGRYFSEDLGGRGFWRIDNLEAAAREVGILRTDEVLDGE